MSIAARALPVAIAAAFLVMVARGLDFGQHWDEAALIDKVEWSVANGGLLLPPTYDWPSASFWVALAALTPELTHIAGLAAADLSTLESRLLATLRTAQYQLRLRWCFATLTSLSVLWVFAASRGLGAGLLEAATAAGILALAWEPAYHARFAVPDGLLMQCGALALWCLVRAARQPASRWVFSAAAAAGLAIGTKYSAWPLLLPIGWIVVRAPGQWPERSRRLAAVVAAAAGAFLVTTPGAVLMPARFAQAMVLQWRHYSTGHGVHTVDAGLDHLWRMGEYLTLELLSPYPPVAVAFALLAVLGGLALWRQAPLVATAVAMFPVAYVLYFSMQRVMIVRNLIILAPFAALAAAHGLARLSDRLPNRALRRVACAGTAVVLALNGAYAIRAGSSIQARHDVDFAAEARAWLRQPEGGPVGLSAGVQQAFGSGAQSLPSFDAERAERWLTFLGEPVCGEPLPANVRGLITLVAGPMEVNLSRYPDWAGDRHLVVVDLGKLRREGRCRGAAG